ncbi:MAG: DUF5717 family protein [Lachnospiraceae bacterium]|nr:DUF5717 family protein [Lachnospiraceae bacterium]
MRKRIRELARGRIGYRNSSLVLSEDKINLEVLEGGTVAGEFSFHTDTDDVVRGNVYSSLSRMECLTPVFDGRKITVRYEFNSSGLNEGDVLRGDFFIVSDCGEYNLSFVVSVLNPYADSSMGNIKSLDDFVSLYKDYPNEAEKIFYSTYFHHIITNNSLFQRNLYEGLRNGSRSVFNIEEFLVECGVKKRIELGCAKNEYEFFSVTENCSDIIEITRNTWGFVNIDIKSDSPFIEFSKNRITDSDFIGMTCYIPMVICADKLHAGKNYGKIVLSNGIWQREISICATQSNGLNFGKHSDSHRKMIFVALGRLYMDYRLGHIVTGKWSDKSLDLLDELIVLDDQPFYKLMKAQLYLANGRKQDAEWILNDYRRAWDGIEDEVYGYYLYVNTLYNKEDSYVNRLIDKVNDIYIRNRESALLFFCILNLNSEYVKDRHARYLAICNFVEKYGHSYTLETEALNIVLSEPYCAASLNLFVKRILLRADRYGYLDEKICQRIVQLADRESTYDPCVRRLLESSANILEDEESITVLCSYLVKNHIYDEGAFYVYEKGINSNVRVAGIYEAYLESSDSRKVSQLPHIILMYFKAHSHLPYQQKAQLLVSIIANKENDPATYEDYHDQIVKFAYEQLELSRVDDSLSVIYGDVFDNYIRIREVASQLASVLFVHRVTCFDPNTAFVVVREKGLKNETKVPVKNHLTYVNIYTNDRQIFMEDMNGNRSADKNLYQLEMLMPVHKYLKTCLKYAPEEFGYLLSYFKNKTSTAGANLDDIYMLESLFEDGRISEEYRNELAMRYSHFLDDRGRADIVIRAVNFDKLSDEDRIRYIELLIDNSVLDSAYRFIRDYSIYTIDVKYLYRVVSYIIREVEFEDDYELLDICMILFEKGCQKPDLLMYLEKHAQGSSKNLEKVLRVIRKADLPRLNLTERLLIQSLFSTEYISMSQEIFEDYVKEGDPEVIDAYLTYQNHMSFSKDVVVSERLFLYTKERILIDDNVPAVMKFSLAKYLVEKGELKPEDEKLVTGFIAEWLDLGLYFKFYKKLSHDIQEKLHIFDQTIIEYRTTPRKRVKIYYRLSESDEYIREDLQEMYYGIYVKHTTLFFGESMQYYIVEENGDREDTLESGKLDNLGISGNNASSRYDYLNELLMAYYLGETDALDKMIKEYVKKTKEVQSLFELMG